MLRETKVLQNKKGKCMLKLSGNAFEDEMTLIIKNKGVKTKFEMNHLDVCYLIEALLIHNDIELDDYNETIKMLND